MRAAYGAAWAAGLLVLGAACSRSSSSASEDAGARPPSAPSHGAATSASAEPGTGQAKYLILGVLNPLLRPHLQVLGDHFGGEGDEPFAVERVDLSTGKTALLVSRIDSEDPMVLFTDGSRLVWSSALPTTGDAAPFSTIALARGPDDGASVFGYVAAKRELWVRTWSPDGTAAAPMRVGTVAACPELSAAYGPGLGWIVACASKSGTQAERLPERGPAAWGESGMAVGAPSAAGPASLFPIGGGDWLLAQEASRPDGDHVLVFRYDEHGQPRWPAPADLGVPRDPSRLRRLSARWQGDVLHVDVPQGLAGPRVHAAEVTLEGAVRLLP